MEGGVKKVPNIYNLNLIPFLERLVLIRTYKMSYLKDSKYVKSISRASNFKELTEDSCRFILSEVELTLRKVILRSMKYTRKFKRN